MAVWMEHCGRVHDVADVATDVEIVAPDEVREFVAAHGGRLFVWVSTHPGMLYVPCLLETSLEPPRKRDLSFRRVRAPGFDLYLEGTQKTWPRSWSSPSVGGGASRPTGTAWPGSPDVATGMTGWTPKSMGMTEVTDVATDVEIVAPEDVRDFVAAHGGRLFVWISVHPGVRCTLSLLEASLKPPRERESDFRRIKAPGFDLYLEATQRFWPKTMEFGLRRHRRVEAYWNGLAWIA